MRLKLTTLLILLTISFGAVAQSADSSKTDSVKIKPPKNPKLAITLSAILPGAGQVYNGKFYKVPIFYGLGGAAGYYCYQTHILYKNYLHDHLILQDTNNHDTTSFLTDIRDVNTLAELESKTRRKRDLFGVAVIGVWALNIIDAYVDAELSNFDVSENLTLYFAPNLFYYQSYPYYGFTFRLKF